MENLIQNILAISLGMMIFFSFVLAPMIFKILDAENAGKFVRKIFPYYYFVNFVNNLCLKEIQMSRILFGVILLIFSCEEILDPDTTAPTVVITYPVNSSTLTETTTVTVDVADDGDIGIVKLLVDGIETYADTTAPYEYEWDVCVLGTFSPLK